MPLTTYNIRKLENFNKISEILKLKVSAQSATQNKSFDNYTRKIQKTTSKIFYRETLSITVCLLHFIQNCIIYSDSIIWYTATQTVLKITITVLENF